jgi:acetoin utilization deacetylase AcuC-like enzyme
MLASYCLIQVDEDPNHEFPSTTADDPILSGPRIIDVGIPGPGFHPLLWRRAWRDKVLPALVNFNPDLILVSAGFDAHRKDEINFRWDAALALVDCCCG